MSYHPAIKRLKACPTAESGMVVIVALFMVAIIAALSYAMIFSLSQDTHRTEMLLHDLELSNQAQGGILWAKDLLITNFQKKTNDKRVDVMPFTSSVNDTGRFRIVSKIEDLQARYNINRLADAGGNEKEIRDEFIRLLKALSIQLNDKQLNELIDAIKDWLSISQGNPALNNYYESLPFPYRSAHQKMTHISELLLVKGMNETIYNKLKPYVTALPENAMVNILQAEAPVLTTLSNQLNLEKALLMRQAMVNIKTSDKVQLAKNPFITQYSINNNFTVISDFFLVETSVTMESQQLIIYTLMHRIQSNDAKVDVEIIWQSKGVA